MLNENVEDLRNTIDTLGYDEKGSELTSGGGLNEGISDIVEQILKEFKRRDPNTVVNITAGNDKYHKGLNYTSKHSSGNAVDVTLNPYNQKTSQLFIEILNRFKSNPKFKYIDEYKNASRYSTGGHFHLEYDDGTNIKKIEPRQLGPITASSEVLTKILNLLKLQDISPENLKPYIDPIENTTGSKNFTELDIRTEDGFNKYAEICDAFLIKYKNPLKIDGNMLANGAYNALKIFGRYVPPELALAQLVLEGGLNGDINSKPIRTNNPFNVGNVDSGGVKTFSSTQQAIDAYYKLIASNFIGKGKTINDLLTNFVSKSGKRYATAPNYENKIASISQKVNQIAKSVLA